VRFSYPRTEDEVRFDGAASKRQLNQVQDCLVKGIRSPEVLDVDTPRRRTA
jgi:hypothetical protein